MTDTTRDAFEAEANLYDLDLNRFKEGYSDCNTEYSWTFWQAATLAEKRQPLTFVKERAQLEQEWCELRALTAASKRQPLTDEQIEKCVEQVWGSFAEFDEVRLFTRAIEAAHGIKA